MAGLQKEEKTKQTKKPKKLGKLLQACISGKYWGDFLQIWYVVSPRTPTNYKGRGALNRLKLIQYIVLPVNMLMLFALAPYFWAARCQRTLPCILIRTVVCGPILGYIRTSAPLQDRTLTMKMAIKLYLGGHLSAFQPELKTTSKHIQLFFDVNYIEEDKKKVSVFLNALQQIFGAEA